MHAVEFTESSYSHGRKDDAPGEKRRSPQSFQTETEHMEPGSHAEYQTSINAILRKEFMGEYHSFFSSDNATGS